MDKAIKKGFERVKTAASKQESKLMSMDKKRDAKCDAAMKSKRKK